MKVLLVEDEATFATVLARGLRGHGHSVEIRGSAEDATISMMEDWPDAIVVDVNLPDASGWEILRGLDEHDRALLRVIIISGSPLSQIRVAEFRPTRTFLKPFSIDTILHALEATPVVETRFGPAGI